MLINIYLTLIYFQTGKVRTGYSGQVKSGKVKSGQVKSGKVESAKVEPGEVYIGQVRQERSTLVISIQDMLSYVRSSQAMSSQNRLKNEIC